MPTSSSADWTLLLFRAPSESIQDRFATSSAVCLLLLRTCLSTPFQLTPWDLPHTVSCDFVEFHLPYPFHLCIILSVMEENLDPTAAIDRLRRQRAHKRGLVTKLLKKIQSLDTCHPDDLDLVVIDGLSDELSSTVSAHNQIQAQINDLVLDSEEAYESELVESERHDEIHTDLRRTLRRVRERYQLWSDSNSIVGEMKLLLAATDTTSPRFEARF